MFKVICLETGNEYTLTALSGYHAMVKFLNKLNVKNFDKNAKVYLYNEKTWEFKHCGKTYRCSK